ncbi:MAG: M24 family metallopeptidase [bacterium]|nr:M24 family metallopeptidase [bacterium]
MKIPLKTANDIEIMRKGGVITTRALRAVKEAVKAGVTTLELDAIAEKTIRDAGAEPSFKRVPGYKWTLCTCVNDTVVHGVPTTLPLMEGDILGIDIGAYLDGFHTDLSYSVLVTKDGYWEPDARDLTMWSDAKPSEELKEKKVFDVNNVSIEEKKKFMYVGMLALLEAIKVAQVGGYIGDISHVLQTNLEGAGYGVVKELIGHGVGKDLHEPPQVPGRGKCGTGIVLKEGMVLAIEAIYSMKSPKIAFKNNDGWTIVTEDFSLACLYEQSVAILPSGPEVLTVW